ncbi:P-loop containing nucleoside triphosphate hydrolase protein [Lipomyces oligophaga]|uniref:P-loop containing nucleoside triphosphate hydrolase protein n=1 Tax=Lipomyces oligophaga TaxID=45792 RepID=UPI0034CD48B1
MSKPTNSLLSVPQRRTNSMRPPSMPLSSSSSSRLNRVSEIAPGPKSRRPTNEILQKKKEQTTANVQPISRSSSRSSVRSTGASASENGEAATNKETNIHVYVRCRGRNDREIKENSGVVIDCHSPKEITIQTGPLALSNKTYSFDHIFGPEADQSMVYDEVVSPILEEAMAGYNCTIFAYGQTGTGKTYTMSGDVSDNLGSFANDAGIIPRVLYRLFLALESEQSEYSVKCSFIELYNEELRDLICNEDDRKVKIYEDTAKKGIIIQGMEETFIKNASEGLRLLQEGSHKRQVAATKCNDLSSRSHTVFTITVHVKEISNSGEEFLRTGKLNLVDLAGSENINRSGAENKRAREAGMINQSLLTLGRVINALVDRSSHIPYRESKLTRLLQDSLGGRTKTCIIATVSPAKMNLEETVSTLDYASRAKNIRNKPQVNQVMAKKTLIKEYIIEIERLKSDLSAARQKNGVYITQESFQEITEESESRRILIDEQKRKLDVIDTQLKTIRGQYEQTVKANLDTRRELESTSRELTDTQTSLTKSEQELQILKQSLQEEVQLRRQYEDTESQLSQTAQKMIVSITQANDEIKALNDTMKRKDLLASNNQAIFTDTQKLVDSGTQELQKRIAEFSNAQVLLCDSIVDKVKTMLVAETATLGGVYKIIDSRVTEFDTQQNALVGSISGSKEEMNQVLEQIKELRDDIRNKVGEGLNGLTDATEKIAQELISQIELYQNHTSTSYNQLGRDFKSVFDEVQRHMKGQNLELEKLHQALLTATRNASDSFGEQQATIKVLVEQELEAAENAKKMLIQQVLDLIEANSREQTIRLNVRADKLSENSQVAKGSIDSAGTDFTDGISGWFGKQFEFQTALTQNRDRIKQNVVESYYQSSQQGDELQNSTKVIHAQTNKIVAEQKENLSNQMQALDIFVTNARAKNENFHESYLKSIVESRKAISDGMAAAKTGIDESGRGLHAFASETNGFLDASKREAGQYGTTAKREIGILREKVTNSSLLAYKATGQTPKPGRNIYEVPAKLPRTIKVDSTPTEENVKPIARSSTASLDLAMRMSGSSLEQLPFPSRLRAMELGATFPENRNN